MFYMYYTMYVSWQVHHVEIESTIIMKLSARAELNISSHVYHQVTGSSSSMQAILYTSSMSTQQGDIIERAVNAALADIEEHAPQEFQKLQADPA